MVNVSSTGIWFQFNTFSSSMLLFRKNSKAIFKEYFGIELGLSFCSSQANFNRETFVNDVFQFVRRLKLREFFSDKNTKDTSENISQKITKRNEDRSALGWTIKNPHWYPDAVREGRSVGLVNFIENSLHDFRQHLTRKSNKHFNNLTNKQRDAINSLSTDETIVIKPADNVMAS